MVYELIDGKHYVTGNGTKILFKTEADALAYLDEINLEELNELKNNMLSQTLSYYQKYVESLTSDSPDYEKQTWDIQAAEWNSWNKDNTSPTPFVDKLALSRGVDRLVLLDKIGIKVLAIADILGKQQSTCDAIKAATTIDELNAVQVPTNDFI